MAERVMERIAPGRSLLDVGCGTGEDAWWLAEKGYVVCGIDESAQMIERATSKANRPGLSIEFLCRSLAGFAAEGRRFDAVISNFGALNCVPLATWTDLVPALLNPGGRGLVALMGDRPLPEHLRGKRGTRESEVETRVGGQAIAVHYESVASIRQALERTVRVDRVEAMGCLVPGPGFADFPRRHPVMTGILAMGEVVTRRAPWFRSRGDHTLFEFTAR